MDKKYDAIIGPLMVSLTAMLDEINANVAAAGEAAWRQMDRPKPDLDVMSVAMGSLAMAHDQINNISAIIFHSGQMFGRDNRVADAAYVASTFNESVVTLRHRLSIVYKDMQNEWAKDDDE